ncbi:MAG: type II secretion system protein GspJ [Halieaceae bacterium]|nr:type II secretion system protein GspJ [Halieaceae bacterium]RPG92741.1 MAG: type II secretion system protein GspJ [Cellvibrionales bacterium TMED157]
MRRSLMRLANPHSPESGFTLVEVLIAMAITAFVSVLSYQTLSTALAGIESARTESERLYEINRAFTVLSRDVRQMTNRPVRDEFGQMASAVSGGELARDPLRLTRSGWHNSTGAPRSTLQRVAYRLEEDKLLRLSYPVLDRTTAIEPTETVLIDGVEVFELRFLPSVNALEVDRNQVIDRRFWQENWVADVGFTDKIIDPPAAIEVRVILSDWGELERLYVMPSFQ